VINLFATTEVLLRKRLTTSQLLLLRACLWDEKRAVDAWEKWRISNSIDTVDSACSRLLPMMYKRLLEFNIKEPMIDRLKGAYRYTWVNNVSRLKHAENIATLLTAAGIEVIFLKGVPLLLNTYDDSGVRFINDIDILIDSSKAKEAVELLLGDGHIMLRESQRVDAKFDYALSLKTKTGILVDVHWHALCVAFESEVDQCLRQHLQTLMLGRTPILALSNTEQLLIACVHVTLDSIERQVRYMADAYKLISSPKSNLCWSRLVELALECRVAHMVLPALNLVRTELGADIPKEVIEKLEIIPRTLFHQIENTVQICAPSQSIRLARRWCLYKRGEQINNSQSGFANYLTEYYGLTNKYALLPHMIRHSRSEKNQ